MASSAPGIWSLAIIFLALSVLCNYLYSLTGSLLLLFPGLGS